MKNDNYLDLLDCKKKAIKHAMWLNFKYRIAKIQFVVIHGTDNNLDVQEEAISEEMELPFLNILPKDYSEMIYDDIRHIKMQNDPLPFWDKITGIFSVVDGEILRYILHAKIPLKKLIRHKLASSGYDENHRWCGFGKAEDRWLSDN